MKQNVIVVVIVLAFLCVVSQVHSSTPESSSLPQSIEGIPSRILTNIRSSWKEFLQSLDDVLQDDKNDLFILVDKKHHLQKDFVPYSLVELQSNAFYQVSRAGHQLTPEAEEALMHMARSAKKDGITIMVSSTYRTYEYQVNLFKRYAREYGEKEADRFSARPGATQHRLGTVIDFGSISDDYAMTPAGKWLYANAAKYGWSLSYPKGFEQVTGYKWECWHYRYLGVEACVLQKKYFEDVQQYLLEFIHWWKKNRDK